MSDRGSPPGQCCGPHCRLEVVAGQSCDLVVYLDVQLLGAIVDDQLFKDSDDIHT
jgi:hypothetical protein